MEKLVNLNFERLKRFDGHYQTLLYYAGIHEGDISHQPIKIKLELPFTDNTFKAIDKCFTQLLNNFKLINYYDELLSWVPVLTNLIERSRLDYQLAEDALINAEKVIKLMQFRDFLQDEHEIEIRITNKSISKKSSLNTILIPNTDALASALVIDTAKLAINDAIENIMKHSYVFALDDWLPENRTLENLLLKLKGMTVIKHNPVFNQSLAYAIDQWLPYLHQKELFRYSGNFFSNSEAVFIQNYLTIFQLIPGAKVLPKMLDLTTDINFNNNLRNGIKSVRSFPKSFV